MAEGQCGIHRLLEKPLRLRGAAFAFLNFCCDGTARIIAAF
jgi:hypothetical protein